jgi:hypothetical protein
VKIFDFAKRSGIILQVIDEPETHVIGDKISSISSYVIIKDQQKDYIWIAKTKVSFGILMLICQSPEEKYQTAVSQWMALVEAIRDPQK